MLYVFVGLIVLGCAAVLMGEGLYSAMLIAFCTVLGGLVAFNFFEPLAGQLESATSFLQGYGDIIALLGLFAVSVTVFRLVTEQLAPEMIELPDLVHRGGGFIIGAITGWFVAGILLCAIQTLPLHQNFLGYDYRDLERGNGLHADRYWIAFMHHVSGKTLEQTPPNRFDASANFALRYHLYRRTNDEGKVETGSGVSVAGEERQRSAGRGRARTPGRAP